jgi:small-conductance mechanosensitive channel
MWRSAAHVDTGGSMQQLADTLEGWMPWLGHVVLGQPLLAWITAVAVAAVVYTILMVVRIRVTARLGKITSRTSTTIDDVFITLVRSTSKVYLTVVSSWFGLNVLDISDRVSSVAGSVLVIATFVQLALWGNTAVTLWVRRRTDELESTDPGTVTTLQGLSYVIRVIVWSAALLLALDNLGVDVTALVAGLGVGGIAVALAVQSILSDLFASLSIALDKPFVIGDFIIVGDFQGTIEKIGLKTTRVRSLSGEQIIFSNSDMLTSRIRNYKRMQERRVPFTVGVTYQTPVDDLEAIPGVVREIIESVDGARFDRAHFKGLGESAFLFEFVYYVLSADYNQFMDVQQVINLGICRTFEDRGINFAYPTRTLHLEGPGATTSAES